MNINNKNFKYNTMLKEIKEFLFKSKQAKRLETLESMSQQLECTRFSMNPLPNIFKCLDTTDNDRKVANDMIQDLMGNLEKQFKIDYQNYINSEIEKLDRE